MKYVLTILPFLLFACEPIEFGEIETYTVSEGQHKSDFPYVLNGKVIRCKVMFTESCRYEPLEKDGWNKLIGLTTGLLDIHKNSARWAWRYDYETGEIKLASYLYINGDRQINYHFSVPIGEWIGLYIAYNKELTKWEYYTSESEMIGGWMRCDKFKQKDFWWTGLYFGGQSVAPHDVTVHYKFEK